MIERFEIDTTNRHTITSNVTLCCAETGRVIAVFYNDYDAEAVLAAAPRPEVGQRPVPTVTSEMKARFIGEFSWTEDDPYYDEDGIEHERESTRVVPWDLCKTIFKQMYAEFVAAAPQQAAEPVGWLKRGGRIFKDSLHIEKAHADRSAGNDKDAEVVPVYAGHLPAQPVCVTCNGHGMIGGPSYREPDEGGVPCPDCTPAQPEQPAPIPTCERLPTEADADYSGAVFAFTAFTKEWVLQHWAHVADCPNAYLYWQKTGLTRPAAPDSGDVL